MDNILGGVTGCLVTKRWENVFSAVGDGIRIPKQPQPEQVKISTSMSQTLKAFEFEEYKLII